MLQIDLATLSANELRRLIEVAKSRGQDGLAARLSAELVARRRIRPVGPPPDAARMSFDREAWSAPSPAPVRGRRGPPFAALAATGLVALAVGWGASLQIAPQLERPVRLTSAPAVTRVMLARTEPVPLTAPLAPPPVAAAPRENPPARSAEPAKANPCLDLPTPGERLVCGYPSLGQQDRALTAAYDRAMANTTDPEALERAQADWRQAKNGVWDRSRLADMYAERIRQLEVEAAP